MLLSNAYFIRSLNSVALCATKKKTEKVLSYRHDKQPTLCSTIYLTHTQEGFIMRESIKFPPRKTPFAVNGATVLALRQLQLSLSTFRSSWPATAAAAAATMPTNPAPMTHIPPSPLPEPNGDAFVVFVVVVAGRSNPSSAQVS